MTLHLPTAILGPVLATAIISAVGSYWWLIKKTIQLSGIVQELQQNQAKLTKKVDSIT